jgi:hypothetical protein
LPIRPRRACFPLRTADAQTRRNRTPENTRFYASRKAARRDHFLNFLIGSDRPAPF